MRTAIFGGSFNPPHLGHIRAATAAREALNAERLIVIPANLPPHKREAQGSPGPWERLRLTRLAFERSEAFEVSDMELQRGGKSYTVDTLEELHELYPDDELMLLMGADMLLSFDTVWYGAERILKLASLGVFPREAGQDDEIKRKCEKLISEYGAKVEIVDFVPTAISSTELRELLRERGGREFFPGRVYSDIIRNRFYDAQPELGWLREQASQYMDKERLPHVLGCEREAVHLAERWGADPMLAAEAAILHDITKREKDAGQLKLCDMYGIITDSDEKANYKLLHSKTGAALSKELFGISDEVYNAIYWHTTARAGMSLLEKIIYMADYIEPTRHFEGVDKLRKLAYEDLDGAIILGLEMSLEDLRKHGAKPHINSVNALAQLRKDRNC